MSSIETFQQIAEAYQTQGKYQERDRFLVLALDAAHSSGQHTLAEQLRLRLLELNPNHLIKPYASSTAALQASNFMTYVAQLRKNYPVNKAQILLQELGVTPALRPRRTMIAESSFPAAEQVEDRKTPTWSQFNVEVKPKPIPGPSVGVYQFTQESVTMPANDPLANIPMSSQQPVQFKLEPPATKPNVSDRKVEIVTAPNQQTRQELHCTAGAWVGNFLFLILFLGSIATLAYIFVLPFYPEIAKILK